MSSQAEFVTYLESSQVEQRSDIENIFSFLKQSAPEGQIAELLESERCSIIQPSSTDSSSQDAALAICLIKFRNMNRGQALVHFASVVGNNVPQKSFALALFSIHHDNLNCIPCDAVAGVQPEDLQSLGMSLFRINMVYNSEDLLDDDDADFFARGFQERIVRERLRNDAVQLLAKYGSHTSIDKSELFHLSLTQLVVFYEVCFEEERVYKLCAEEDGSFAHHPDQCDTISKAIQLACSILEAKGIAAKSSSSEPTSSASVSSTEARKKLMRADQTVSVHAAGPSAEGSKKLKTFHSSPLATLVTPPVVSVHAAAGPSTDVMSKTLKTFQSSAFVTPPVPVSNNNKENVREKLHSRNEEEVRQLILIES